MIFRGICCILLCCSCRSVGRRSQAAPGVLRRAYATCLIPIKEWAADARRLHVPSDLPAGMIDVQFPALVDAAAATPRALPVLVVSAPQIEVGGGDGQAALACWEQLRDHA